MEKVIYLALAFLAAWAITPVVARKAVSWGAVDLPGPRKIHKKAMPRLGGLALYLSFLVGAPLILKPACFGTAGWGLLAGATVIVLVGVVDDIRGLNPWLKLSGQVAAALFLELVLDALRRDRLHEGNRLVGRERREVERPEASVEAHRRRKSHGEVKVAGALVDDKLKQLVE